MSANNHGDYSRADWSQSDGRRPPIMGPRQSFNSYIRDCEQWYLCIDVPPEKAGPLVLTRGMHQNSRVQEVARRCDLNRVCQSDGLKYLLLFVAKELGVSEVPAQIERFADLMSRKRRSEPVESWCDEFLARWREVQNDGLVHLQESQAALMLIISLQLSQQQMSNLCTGM